MTFYETLTLALEQKSMTAADICAKTGIYPSYFSNLKSGHTKDVTWEKALQIIDALGMTPDEFYRLQMEGETDGQAENKPKISERQEGGANE